jgi:hypothetical protein
LPNSIKRMRYSKRGILPCLLVVLILASCTKVPIEFGGSTQTQDPNITYLDGYRVDLATFRVDSFTTSGSTIPKFVVGYHVDPLFGRIKAETYAQFKPPVTNNLKDQQVIFDSMVLILKPSARCYGDTLASAALELHKVMEPIQPDNSTGGNFYNPHSLQTDPAPIGVRKGWIRPVADTQMVIRISDAIGAEWLAKLRNNDLEMQSDAAFIEYFRGLCLRSDTTATKSLYFLQQRTGIGPIRLYYHQNLAIPGQSYIDFPITSTFNQFSHIEYNQDGTPLEVFTPFKRQTISSVQTGGHAFLNSAMGTNIRLTFPDILNLKELHPYIQVLQAQLVITPAPGSYNYPYWLPASMGLYETNTNNDLLTAVKIPGTSAPQTGNLQIDLLYGKDTRYTYDITTFINQILANGIFTSNSLVLAPGGLAVYDNLYRLVINDQSLQNGVKLKMYVLGL